MVAQSSHKAAKTTVASLGLQKRKNGAPLQVKAAAKAVALTLSANSAVRAHPAQALQSAQAANPIGPSAQKVAANAKFARVRNMMTNL